MDGTLVIAMPLPFGLRYLYAPRGVCSLASSRPNKSASERRDLVKGMGNIARETSAVFWRAECPTPPTPSSRREGGEQNLYLTIPRVLRRAVEPEWTWRVSLEPDEGAMLAAMHEKHRYNVRLAQKRGVRVSQCFGESVRQEHSDAFWLLLQETAKRQGIVTHPESYYETMLRVFDHMSDVKCLLYLDEREGAPCAAAIVVYYGDTATYLHGGSAHTQRQHMAPHLLHWTAMRDAKAAGMRWYDFGGVSLEDDEQRWSGMTRFKQGFGGEAVHHAPMCDLVFRRGWYTMLAALTQMRSWCTRRS